MVAIASLLCSGPVAVCDDLPNVVMIMADDWGWSDIAAYRRHQGLSDPIPTPNLDRLCAEGMMFTDAHSPAALCAPTRFSMMTGSNPYRNGVQWGTWGFTGNCAFTRDRKHTTVGEVAQSGGYRTAFFGKMHFGGGSTNYTQVMPEFPTTYGFDYVFASHGGIQDPPYLYFENDRFVKIDPADALNPSVPGQLSDLKEWASGNYAGTNGTSNIQNSHAGTGDVNWNSSQNGVINARKAAAFIGDHLTNHPGQPFMIYYCSPQVHVPHTPPVDFEPDAAGNPGSPPNSPVEGHTGGTDIADITYELDLQVGWIIDKLEDPNGDGNFADSILTNTLVMFTSDNGGLTAGRGFDGYDSTGVLRGSKAQSYEGGHRVPFVAMWAGTIETNSVSDQLIGGHDWVGLMYALTGNSMDANQAMDCANILPILLGEQPENEPVRDFMVLQGHNVSSSDNSFILRRDEYVLLMDDNRDPVELYNLSNDFAQVTNLIAESSEQQRIADMAALFYTHDQKNDQRCTTPYDLDGFATPPTPSASDTVRMTSVTGIAAAKPVQYRFIETSGEAGGSSSGWQTSPDYVDTGLLPDTTYAYRVEMRDGNSNSLHSATQAVEVVTEFHSTPFYDDFSGSPNPANTNAPVTGTWYLPTGDYGEGEDASVATVAGTNSAQVLRLGWGYDVTSTRLYLDAVWDHSYNYAFSFDWEKLNALTGTDRGFDAIVRAVDGSGADQGLIKSVVNIGSNTVKGATGSVSIAVNRSELVAAGANPTHHIALWFWHNSGGGSDKNDVYGIDNVAIEAYERTSRVLIDTTFANGNGSFEYDNTGSQHPDGEHVNDSAPWVLGDTRSIGSSINVTQTRAWTKLGGTHGSLALVINGSEGGIQNTGYNLRLWDTFDLSFDWRDAWQWDAADTLEVQLFSSDDDTLGGNLTSIYSGSFSKVTDASYQTVSLRRIGTVPPSLRGRDLWIVFNSGADASEFARVDNVSLSVLPGGTLMLVR